MRIVVKVGTSVIAPDGEIDTNRLRELVDQLDLMRHEYLIVSSGAIAAGMSLLGLHRRPKSVQLMQACAAVGQSQLMHTYGQLFFGKKPVAQLLLTSDDFSSATRYRNLCNTLDQLLRFGVVPVVNENDSVSVRELVGAFGDNDELSAMLAVAVKADWLVLFTDVDGFHDSKGRNGRRSLRHIIRRITPAMEAACNGHGRLGRGGMRSKLHAAREATAAGIHVVIANGTAPRALELALKRRLGTYFPPSKGPA